MKTKTEIRKAISIKRKDLSPAFLKTSSQEIIARLQQLDSFQHAKTVALYMSFGGEVQLDELFPICWATGKKTCIPVYNEHLKQYDMAEITEHTEFRTGHYGIREPVSPSLISLQDIDLMAVPGVAFDSHGGRLGRGGGFYDRMLYDFTGKRVAVAFNFQLIDNVPIEEHDLPVHIVISEIKTLNVSNER